MGAYFLAVAQALSGVALGLGLLFGLFLLCCVLYTIASGREFSSLNLARSFMSQDDRRPPCLADMAGGWGICVGILFVFAWTWPVALPLGIAFGIAGYLRAKVERKTNRDRVMSGNKTNMRVEEERDIAVKNYKEVREELLDTKLELNRAQKSLKALDASDSKISLYEEEF